MERAQRDALLTCAQIVSGSVLLFTIISLFATVSLRAELTTHFKVFYLAAAAASAAAFAMRRKWRWLAFAGVLTAIHVPGVFVWYLPAPKTPSGAAESNLRIVTANLLTVNPEHGLFLDFIEDSA